VNTHLIWILAVDKKASTTLSDFLAAAAILVAIPVVVLVVTYLVARLASRRLGGTLSRAGFQINVAILLSRAVWIGVWTLGFFLELRFFGLGLAPLAAFIGVIGLAASLSLQAVLQNLVAGVYLLAERPFKIGDTIAVIAPGGVNHEGTVEDVQMRTTHLRSKDNELVLVPNAAIFSGVVTNRTAVGGYALHVSLTCPRASDLTELQVQSVAVLETVPGILSSPAPSLRVDRVSQDSWTVSLLFWSNNPDVRSSVVWSLGRSLPAISINDDEAVV
jgi:small conductance mechanosensitive channel